MEGYCLYQTETAAPARDPGATEIAVLDTRIQSRRLSGSRPAAESGPSGPKGGGGGGGGETKLVGVRNRHLRQRRRRGATRRGALQLPRRRRGWTGGVRRGWTGGVGWGGAGLRGATSRKLTAERVLALMLPSSVQASTLPSSVEASTSSLPLPPPPRSPPLPPPPSPSPSPPPSPSPLPLPSALKR